ncbi:helix-turn-helix domain-containing protein [Streptomyces sp. RK9]|uniref:helix-turn-helix domain-containing protein n=1 Tax=Streptomyces sp. RK9 TaxID=3239284 RepID=UPI00386FCB83
MTAQQPSAPTRAQSGASAGRVSAGLHHVTERHPDRFTVVGNHLAQHHELSLTAIGLAVHIQSLPAGSRIGVKVLAQRFPEGEMRIAAALRELEAHGYLARTKERLASGRIVTRTVSYNMPQAYVRSQAPMPQPTPAATPAPALAPVPPARPAPEPAPQPAPPANPTAITLLTSLRAHDPRLLLAEGDVHRLAPAVTAWLARGVPPAVVRHALTSDLPQDPLRRPAALLAHRLTERMPPPLPEGAEPREAAARPLPMQTCDGCERAFRGERPGRCRDCRPSRAAA